MMSTWFLTLFTVFISVSSAERPLTHSELNTRIECMRETLAMITPGESHTQAWYKLHKLINDHAKFSDFINCEIPGSADIRTPFAYKMEHVDFGSRAQYPLGMDVDLLVFRGDPGTLALHEVPSQTVAGFYQIEPEQGAITRERVKESNDVSLRNLYEEFSEQKGIAEHVGEYTAQDQKPIATHFVLMVKDRPVARIQVQISSDHSIELNYEEDFPTIEKQSPDGVRRAEIGRNGILRSSKRSADVNQAIENGGGDEHLKNLMFQKVFSWINADVAMPEVRFHVNGAVRRNWMRTFAPVKFDAELILEDHASPARVEWLLTYSRKSLQHLEDRAMAKGLLDNLKKIESDPEFRQSKNVLKQESHMGEKASYNLPVPTKCPLWSGWGLVISGP